MEKINFNSGKIMVSDPCYAMGFVDCTRVLNIKKGDYIMSANTENETSWGYRIKELIIKHIDYQSVEPTEFDSSVCVDSGQCGFFDYEYYKKYHKKDFVDEDEEDNAWYHRVCDITLNDPMYGIIDNMGCVSESGYGDGRYGVYVAYNSEMEIVAVKIVFIEDDYDEEDDEDEDDGEWTEI